MWRDKWQRAYERASFFNSFQNTTSYWDKVAEGGGAGLAGDNHINLLLRYFEDNNVFDNLVSLLDVGCGGGDYSAAFAKKGARITAMDSSLGMLNICKELLEKYNINSEYLNIDFNEYETTADFDIVLACLNPATYCPDGFDKLLSLTRQYLVYMSMDTSIEEADSEPIYCGTNSVRYAMNYLDEIGISYDEISYDYQVNLPNGKVSMVPFKFIIAKRSKH